jgi:putative tricarboxylic transport membrane protein
VTDRIAGAAIVVFGGWFLWQGGSLREGPGYAAIGPRVFPVIVGLGIVLSGLALVIARSGVAAGVRLAPGEDAGGAAEEPVSWTSLTQVAALLAAYVAAFLPLGFIASSTLFMIGGARILGSRRWARDLAAAALLSVISYAVFTILLGLDLPDGPFQEPLRILRGYAR